MRDTKETRKYFAEVAANWIKNGDNVVVLELKRHTQDARCGLNPFYNWAIRDARGNLVDIDLRHFCDLLGARHTYPDTGDGLDAVLRDAGYIVYRQTAVIVILERNNPLLRTA